jgi:pimeloyl-ACP methyl ester carboxylesterase
MSDHQINTKGAAIYLGETGEGEPALLFLHYWGGSSRTWSSVMQTDDTIFLRWPMTS